MYDSKIILNTNYDFSDLKPGGFAIALCYNHDTVFKIEDKWMEIRDKIYYFKRDCFVEYILCRKGMSEKSVVENVIKHGVGGINIDASRIKTNDKLNGGATNSDNAVFAIEGFDRPWMHNKEKLKEQQLKMRKKVKKAEELGRFPSHLILDGSEEVCEKFPCTGSNWRPNKANGNSSLFGGGEYGKTVSIDDSGSASRFYKEIKTDNELIEYFKKMITPENGECQICR